MSDSLKEQLMKLGFKKPESEIEQKKLLNENQKRFDSVKTRARGRDQNVSNSGPKPVASTQGKSNRFQSSVNNSNGEISIDSVDLAKAYALRAQDDRATREAAARHAEEVARANRERKQKMTALLNGKSLNKNEVELTRHFEHRGKIRRLYVDSEQLQKLNCGQLGVVFLAGRYLLVELEIIDQVRMLDAKAIALLVDSNAPMEDDIPPDLIW